MATEKCEEFAPSCGATAHSEKCPKCGYRLRKGNLPLNQIVFSELNGVKGISIENQLFLVVDHDGKRWRFKLLDTMLNRQLTAWIVCRSPSDLKTSRAALMLRNRLKERYSNALETLETLVIIVENCADEILDSKEKAAPKNGQLEEFDEETLRRARELLKDPTFFYKLGKVFEQGFIVPKINKPRFVLGEERNKRLLGLLLIGAAKLGMTSLVKLLGEPGTAKDTMTRMWLHILRYAVKHVERSYITAAALRYSKEMESADLLYIPDSPELKGETGRQLRFMRADDGGLVSEYAVRDPETGEMTTKVVELPVKAVVTTSNVVTGDSALELGMWILTTNADVELTRRVKMEKLALRAGMRELFPEDELKVWEAAFYILFSEEPLEELPCLPFAPELIMLLESERSESRRDPDKLYDLISLIAWVRRFQKPREKWSEADFIDLYIALQLGLDAITQTMSDLDKKEQAIYAAVKEAGDLDVTCRYVADKTKIPYKTCYRYLERLVDKGYILKDKSRGRNIYTVFSEKEPKQLLILKGRSFEKPKQLVQFILKSFPSFLYSHQEGEIVSFVDPITGEAITYKFNDAEVEVNVDRRLYPYPYEKVRIPRKSQVSQLKSENKHEKLLPLKMGNEKGPDFIWHRIKPAEPCPLCGEGAVEYEINDVASRQILRRCERCFQKMRRLFAQSIWKRVT